MLPIILQHVRELAELHSGTMESEHYKIITPFPPVLNDFKDFIKETLEFNDPQFDGALAALDTVRAYEFFKQTDNLFYDFSYGMKSEYSLSNICRNFYLKALFTDPQDTGFVEAFTEKKEALRKYKRSTAGDLGNTPFIYTSLTPIQWNIGKVILNAPDILRLKEKTIAVYQDPEVNNSAVINSLIAEINASSYSKIEYDFGFFDVLREWIDPQLFESGKWKFNVDTEALYGENGDLFETDDIKLCYAQRFYLIKNYTAQTAPPQPAGTPVTRDHRLNLALGGSGNWGEASFNNSALTQAPDHRRMARNNLLNLQLAKFEAHISPNILNTATIPPSPHPGFVWVPPTDSIPGHWEGVRANRPPPVDSVNDSVYKIAAVKCRIIPRKPRL